MDFRELKAHARMLSVPEKAIRSAYDKEDLILAIEREARGADLDDPVLLEDLERVTNEVSFSASIVRRSDGKLRSKRVTKRV